MTLYRQLTIAVLAALLLLYLESLAVSFNNTKSLVAQQMEANTQDAATSLAFSMSQTVTGNDIGMLESMLNKVSDSGHYRRIYFVDIKDNTVLERDFPVQVQGVPQWFANIMHLPDYQAEAEVTSDWVILGKLVVVSHPGQAYQNSWQALVRQLMWFSLLGVIIGVVAFLAVRRVVTPLRGIETQANEICEQRFVQQEALPKTRELRAVVVALNRLSSKLKALFDSQADLIGDLRQRSHIDVVTGLSNRTDFDARLNTFVSDEAETHCGALMIIALNNLGSINELAGRLEGNEVLRLLGLSLQRGLEDHEEALVARRQGAEFGLFVPDITEQEADALAASLILEASRISWQHQEQLPLSITMGFTYSNKVTNGPELLSEADMALHSIDIDNDEGWSKFSAMEAAGVPLVSRSALDWKKFIEQTIVDRAVELYIQPTVAVSNKQPLAFEVYARFRTTDDHQLTAGTVIPMVRRFGCSVALDQLVLEKLAETVPEGSETLAVNICAESVRSTAFCEWLPTFLAANKELARRLVIEVSEQTLKTSKSDIRSFQNILARYDSGLAIDHFGLESSSFGYLASIPLRYLKVHRSFVRNIHLSRDNQFYVKALAQLARTREIQIVVEGVETEAEWSVLSALNIDSAQGFLLGHPQALQVDS